MYKLLIFAAIITISSLWFLGAKPLSASEKGKDIMTTKPENYPTMVVAGGCFWCVESEFRRIDGVLYTRSGYTGGHVDHPKYEDTHDSKSGHAEAVEITYDPTKVSYKDLIEFFLTQAHDPTQLNRQGPDIGTQYRSAIFYANDEEKKIAQNVIDKLTAEKYYKKPIVTTLEPTATFWQAEDYHQQYFEKYEARTGRRHINDLLHRKK